MGDIDPSQWKPRRTRGTVIHRTRNHFAYGVILAGSALFGIYYAIYSYYGGNKLQEKLKRDFVDRTEEEVDKRNLMRWSLLAPKRGDTIRKLLQEKDNDRVEK